jgi:hypothetical protein
MIGNRRRLRSAIACHLSSRSAVLLYNGVLRALSRPAMTEIKRIQAKAREIAFSGQL